MVSVCAFEFKNQSEKGLVELVRRFDVMADRLRCDPVWGSASVISEGACRCLDVNE